MKHEKTVFAIAALFIVMGHCAVSLALGDGANSKDSEPQGGLSGEKVFEPVSVKVRSIDHSVFEDEPELRREPVKRNPIFWFVAVAALISMLAAVMLREEKLSLGAAFLSMILGPFATLWSESFWFPVFPGGLLVVAFGLFAAWNRGAGKEEQKVRNVDGFSGILAGYDETDRGLEDGVEVWTFIVGSFLNLAAAGLWIRKESVFWGGVLPAGIALMTLAVFVWRLRQAVALWGITLAVGYLGWMFGPVMFRHPETFLGGGLFVLGCAGAFVRKKMEVSVLFGGAALLGIMVAVSGWAESIWRQPVGWTIGVGLPTVFVALGSALAQKD